MQTITKKEVSCKAFDTIFSYAKQKNIELDSLIGGVPYDLSYLLNKRQRVEWWVWCKVISNSRKYFQLSEYEEMGRSFVAKGLYWEGILWAFFLFTSNKFSRLLYNQIFKIGASMFSCIKHHTEFINSNRFIATAFFEEGYEIPIEWPLMCKGVWEQLGAKIGQKGFTVEVNSAQQQVIFDVSWSKENFLFKIKRSIKWLFNIRKALLEITESRDAILSQYQELEALKNNLEQMVADRTFELRKARDELSNTNLLLKEAHQAQSRFFTNISHEFRTPLTLILGPAKRIMENSIDDESRTDADYIQRNAKKLNDLVNELLDISKIESGEMKLKACPANIVSFVKDIAFSFSALAERKKITFNINSAGNELEAYIDKDKVDKILSNVLSNAFKFTPESGKVELKIIRNEKNAELIISDTGIGIPAAKIDKIFDRFYQVDSGYTREHEGTGIGLALTKELVELHKGKIEVESKEGKGTTFRIYFPLGKEHLQPEEICEEEAGRVDTKEGKTIFSELEETVENHYEKQLTDKLLEKPTLLIVEDNTDVRKYVESILENRYKIYEANDGEEGLTKALECIPDLIISDIMMPKLDGFKLCSNLKTNSRTSHIPVIMLTAKATLEDKINGFETGADDYLMKPFEEEELKARIINLLEQRKRLHEHFRQYGLIGLDKKNITSVDQRFLQRVVATINEHISDTLFGVESLAEIMAVSKSLLFKKISSLMGLPPIELIKRIRLNQAAKLLESKSGNVSEIALEVGFNNPSYFAECFKKQFGVIPSKYNNRPGNI